MLFRQLFEPISSTYTYLLGCEDTRTAILIDPVIASRHRYSAAARSHIQACLRRLSYCSIQYAGHTVVVRTNV